MHLHTFFRESNSLDYTVIQHTWTDWLLKNGQNGVLVFFAISGFVLGLPFVNQYRRGGKKVNIGNYFKRRLTRLEPPYIILLTGFLLVHIVVLNKEFAESFVHYISGIFYAHNLIYNEWNPILPVAWSLETEVQFYIFAPIIALLFKIRKRAWMYITFVAFMLLSIYIGKEHKDILNQYHLGKSVLFYGSFFLLGFLFSDIFLTYRDRLKKKHWIWDVVFFASLAGLFVFSDELPVRRYLRTFLILPLFISTFKGVVANWLITRRFVAVTGGMCYTMYLLHYPLIHLVAEPLKPYFENYNLSYWVVALIVLPIIWFTTAFFFVLIERPCMDKDWPSKLASWFKTKFVTNK